MRADPAPRRSPAAVAALLLLTTAAFLTACAPPPASPSVGRPTVSPLTSATAPSTAAAGTFGPTSSASASQFACQATGGATSATARITDMWLTTTTGRDTLVVQFDNAVTGYALRGNPSGAEFVGGGGKGGTFTLDGSYGLRLDISNLAWTTPPGNQFPHGDDLKQSAPVLLEVRQVGDFEGIVNIAAGLSRQVCPTVSILGDPPRLVLQFSAD